MHGGKREGSGRKPLPPLMKKTPRTVKLPEWLWQWIDSQPGNRPELIEAAIREKHKIGPPC